MPATDEDVLRDALRGSLDDLALAPGCARAIVTRRRRRQFRRRLATAGVTGVAAAAAVAVVAQTAPAAHRGSSAALARGRAVHLTAAQVVLDDLAVKAAAQPATGRYVTLTDDRAPTMQTTVFDSLTGDLWDYQRGGGAPPVTIEKHGSPSSAELAAKLPTGLTALRAFLISDANADDRKAAAFEARARAKRARFTDVRTANDKVFDQAIDYLYLPLVPAAQRSALFRLLAATPGVQVNAHARDSLGRPAIMLRNVARGPDGTTTVFENPTTTRPLEEDFAGAGFTGKDVFQKITFTSTRPADPYRH